MTMGRLNHDQGQPFYSFCLEEVVPDDHLVREIAAVLPVIGPRRTRAPRRLLHGAWRVDLNGRPAGTVSQEDEAHARAQPAAIEAKRAECASASSNSAPALNWAERMRQTSQAEQPNVPPATRLPPKVDDAPSARETPHRQGRARKATDAEQRPTRKPRGQIRAWRAP